MGARIMCAVQGSLVTAPKLPHSRHKDLGVLICDDPDLSDDDLGTLGRVTGQLVGINKSDYAAVQMARQLFDKSRAKTGAPPSDELVRGLIKLVDGNLASPDEAFEMAIRVLDQGQDASVLHNVADQIAGG